MKITDPKGFGEPVLDTDTLFRKYVGFVKAFLYRLHVPLDLIDDGTQEVFLVVHKIGGYREGPAAPKTWLGSIVINVAANMRREHSRRYNRQLVYSLETKAKVSHCTPQDHLEYKRSITKVNQTLQKLKPLYRHVFIQCIINGRSCLEVAKKLKIPVGTVYSRLHTARKEFDAYYNEHDDHER